MSGAASRKRGRSTVLNDASASAVVGEPGDFSSITTLRQQIVCRIEEFGPIWASVAERYHTAPNLDSVLSAIGRNGGSALEAVAASFEMDAAPEDFTNHCTCCS